MSTQNSINSTYPIGVVSGGTGAATLTGVLLGNGTSAVTAVTAGDYGVLISSSSGVPSWLANGTTGQVLTATTSGTPSWANAAAGGITTIDGNSGSVTGSTVTITTGASNAQGTSLFTGSSTTMTQTFTSTDGNYNTALGLNSFSNAATGGFAPTNCTAFGYNTLTGILQLASGNTAIGASALKVCASVSNTAVGYNAGIAMTTGQSTTIIGAGSGVAIVGGSNNTICGAGAGMIITSGNDNVALGQNCMNGITSGSNNIAIGDSALSNQATGSISSNVAIGNSSAYYAAGSYNVCVGQYTGGTTFTAGNVALGYEAMGAGDGGTGYSVCVGYFAGARTAGDYNVLIGYESGGSGSTASGSSNIYIGSVVSAAESNVIRIGVTGSSATQQNKCFIAGSYGVTVTGTAVLMSSSGQLGTVASSQRFKENIVGMGDQSAALYKLRPVTFNYISDDNKSRAYGLIAEEVEQVLPDLVVHNLETGVADSVKYHEMPAMLLNELQKLAARVEQLESLLQSLKQG